MFDKVSNLGQVYTPMDIVNRMISIRSNFGSILEPSSGDGSFSKLIYDITSIELDSENAHPNSIIMDFFDYSIDNKFDTIIGNPPYVSYKNIIESTSSKIKGLDYLSNYDNRTNLYVYFIHKCILHLNDGGEIIFITPREFIKNTSSIVLNRFIYESGTITNWYEYGDKVIFPGYSPSVVIWRFEKDNFSRKTITNDGERNFILSNGQLLFNNLSDYSVKFSDLFSVKVGAVSGMDEIYTHPEGTYEFVCSSTKRDGSLRRMYYQEVNPYIESHKEILINRKIKKFNENNWWEWGRPIQVNNLKRIYVNCKTRDMQPFFLNDHNMYDGSILAIFPKNQNIDLNQCVSMLNGSVDWSELGFKIGGRLCFSQKSLENIILPSEFSRFI